MAKIITLEGGDGVGKQTQLALLQQRMLESSYSVKTLSFPRYDTFFGKVIKAYLDGQFGAVNETPPDAVSMLFALDRADSQKQIIEWRNEGHYVLIDRYLESNLVYQAAKLSIDKRVEFMTTLYDFETINLGITPSDLVVLLALPLDVAEEAMRAEGREGDIHESDIAYSREVHKTYRVAAKEFGWKVVDCMSDTDGRRLSEGEVADKVWDVVRARLL